VPVEYIIHRDNPVPIENYVEVEVPNFNQNTHETVINKKVLVEIVTERAVPVEKIIEAEVERLIENPIYIEQVVERPTPYDTIIEQIYDVIVENIVEVPVEKEIRIPVRTIIGAPVERTNLYQKDVIVDHNVIIPVEGTEITSHQEVLDEDLKQRIGINRVAFSDITNMNMDLRS